MQQVGGGGQAHQAGVISHAERGALGRGGMGCKARGGVGKKPMLRMRWSYHSTANGELALRQVDCNKLEQCSKLEEVAKHIKLVESAMPSELQ